MYLGKVNPLLIITSLQVDLDIPNLKAMCTTWLAEQSHRVKVCEMLLKITLTISSPRIIYITALRRCLLTNLDANIHKEDLLAGLRCTCSLTSIYMFI